MKTNQSQTAPAEVRENIMGTMEINPLLLKLSIPMMISMLVQALYNVVDSVFVSHVSESALTAVSLAFSLQNVMIAVGVGTGVGEGEGVIKPERLTVTCSSLEENPVSSVSVKAKAYVPSMSIWPLTRPSQLTLFSPASTAMEPKG